MISSHKSGFDRLAGIYKTLEFIAFGRSLEKARFEFLSRLATARSILILGEGDGRCLAQLIPLAPHARIHVLDISQGMLDRAAARIAHTDAAQRVTFERADLLTHPLPVASYDAVLTFFFLDCFTAGEAAGLVRKIATALKPGADWLYADFHLPARGLARLYSRCWLAVLYFFFQWQTKLSARELPPAEALIINAGFRRRADKNYQFGLVRAVLFHQPG